MNLLRITLLLVAVYSFLNRFLYTWLPTNYIFDPKVLNTICNSVIAKHNDLSTQESTKDFFVDLRNELANTYGEQYINKYVDEEWVFNNAGGAMGHMIILHASITEYLIIFGSAVGTEGHTGVHFADDYFTILVGEQTAALPYALKPEVYKPGMTHHLQKGYAKQYSMPSGSFALELAQGYIPAMLPFGFLDTFSSTLDIYTLYRTVYLTGRDMLKNLFINRKL
ncbi:C-8 sterol isomerase [Hanseniaspora osmophila]|uniref:C-8 sterol isomerase n=1 Tax=Hanseniaspora osmophila TaxID=56408 RepID=A0A1E5REW8_9ASCO|nr:C-8 sterol isomerase [Hanseniaspora osmophila]